MYVIFAGYDIGLPVYGTLRYLFSQILISLLYDNIYELYHYQTHAYKQKQPKHDQIFTILAFRRN